MIAFKIKFFSLIYCHSIPSHHYWILLQEWQLTLLFLATTRLLVVNWVKGLDLIDLLDSGALQMMTGMADSHLIIFIASDEVLKWRAIVANKLATGSAMMFPSQKSKVFWAGFAVVKSLVWSPLSWLYAFKLRIKIRGCTTSQRVLSKHACPWLLIVLSAHLIEGETISALNLLHVS